VAGLSLMKIFVSLRTVCFKQIVRVGVNWILVFIIIIWPVYRLIGVVPMAKFFALQNVMHQMGAMISSGAVTSRSDLDYLASIQPIEAWSTLYNCYSLNVLIL
jgi:hypothetical protein